MAKGSHKTWGGWETRTCHTCGTRITLAGGAASHHHNNGHPFSLCTNHLDQYRQAKRDLEQQYADFQPITDPDLEGGTMSDTTLPDPLAPQPDPDPAPDPDTEPTTDEPNGE